ncbi:hydroxymethylglutaryl-CoA lyase [Enterococcus sp. DIV0756]|uniref:hydroxymethylglutaryl-CoA lyase n=1 Tax=Enterococcus sp. DIV0756 TaxID=2774636 RepID=UPI003F687A55
MDNRKNQIRFIEVGPRDGFQNLAPEIKVEDKLKIIHGLIDSGVKELEIGSFVNPKAVPQMRHMKEIAVDILSSYNKEEINIICLVPNKRGAEIADGLGMKTITYVLSVSESHNKANVNKSIEESLAELEDVICSFPNLDVRVDLATFFGCPFEGSIDETKALRIVRKVFELGACEVILCDTIGVANPQQVYDLSTQVIQENPDKKICLHLHDTRGMGLVNTYAGMEAGISSFESTLGGLGGCPFAPGATGNTATEDLLYMLNKMEIESGVDLSKYLDVTRFLAEKIGAGNINSHIFNVYKEKELLV